MFPKARRCAQAFFRRLSAIRPWVSLALLLRFQLLLAAVFFLFPFVARRAPADGLFGNLYVLGWMGQATVALAALVASWVFLVTTILVGWHGGARIGYPSRLPYAPRLGSALFRYRLPIALGLAAPTLAAVFVASGEELIERDLKAHLVDILGRSVALGAGFLVAIVVFYLAGLLEAWLTQPKRPRSGLFPELPFWAARLHSLKPPRWQRHALVWLRALLRSPGFGPGYLDLNRQIGRGHAMAVGFTFLSATLYFGYGLASCPLWAPIPMPALAGVLLVVIFLAWTLPALAFFFDRYRVPVLLGVAVLSFSLFHLPGNDHFFALRNAAKEVTSPDPAADLSSFAQRFTDGQKGEPIVVALAAGGGITSAAWTAKVLTALSSEETTGAAFVRSLRLVSAVSGGSVGTMFFVDRLPEPGERLAPDQAEAVWRSAADSSLEPVAWGMAYPDLLRGIVPWPLVGPRRLDRSFLLEDSWRRRLRSDSTLRDWRKDTLLGHKPLVIFNSTVAETGDRFQFATLALQSPKVRKSENPLCCGFFAEFPDRDVAVATAVRLSSTFPFVSSAARANSDCPGIPSLHFVDGGYYDNSGTLSALELLDRLFADEDVRKQLAGRPIFLLTLRAFESNAGSLTDERSGDSWSTAFLSPVTTVVKVRTTTQARRNRWEIGQFVSRWSKELSIQLVDAPYSDVGPLSWRLTQVEKARIDGHWKMKVAAQEGMRRLRNALAGKATAPSVENPAPESPPEKQLERRASMDFGIDLTWLRAPWTLRVLLVLFILWAGLLKRLWQPLGKVASVASWELAFSKRRAGDLFSAWSSLPGSDEAQVRKRLRLQLLLDFLFIPLYASLLSGLCVWAAFRLESKTHTNFGLAADLVALATFPLAAGFLDVVENLCLLVTVRRKGPAQPWQALAGTVAALKFALLGVVLLALMGARFLV